jgi:hypothetical protein
VRDDLDRLRDVPAAFPRPDPRLTKRIRARVLGSAAAPPPRRRLGVIAALALFTSATIGFTAGYLLRPTNAGSATSIAMSVRPAQAIAYQGGFTFYGSLANGEAHQRITIEAKSCEGYEPFHPIYLTESEQGGVFSGVSPYPPGTTTYYRAVWRNGTSPRVTVGIRPRLDLAYILGAYRVTLWGEGIFRGAHGTLQRLSGNRWVTVKPFLVKSPVGPGGWAYVKARLPRGTRVRAVVPQLEVGHCFLAGISNIIRV